MKHTPHLLLPPPWGAAQVELTTDQQQHLRRVLRRTDGSPVTYTDGRGSSGRGVLRSDGVERGEEERIDRGRIVRALVAPPHDRNRARFVVEKLAELGVERLDWLKTARVQGRPPRLDRAQAWASAALEQSRGAWLMTVGERPIPVAEMGAALVCDATGSDEMPTADPVVFAVGPEGGWEDGELAPDLARVRIAHTVLRTETAALVAAARLLGPPTDRN